MFPEILNRDIVLEISNYLLHSDLRNLKFAFPKLPLSRELYISCYGEFHSVLINQVYNYGRNSDYIDHLFIYFLEINSRALIVISQINNIINLTLDPNIFYYILVNRSNVINRVFNCYRELDLRNGKKLNFINKDQLMKVAYKYYSSHYNVISITFWQGLEKSDYLECLVKKYQNEFVLEYLLSELEVEDLVILISYFDSDKKEKFMKLIDKAESVKKLLK